MRRPAARSLAALAAAATAATTATLAGCTSTAATPGAAAGDPTATSPAAPSRPVPHPAPDPSRSPTGPATYGGASVVWPRLNRDASPPALGAVATTRRVTLAGGGTLAAGLTLPRLGGSDSAPEVLTPCGRHVEITGSGTSLVAPSGPDDALVVIDPGHGGDADGATAPDGSREADLVLRLGLDLRAALEPQRYRVVLTRTADIDATLGFRVALADDLRADLAVSLHLDANPRTTTSPVPGTQVYAALADPHGRRAAGVVYQAERRYLDTLAPRVGGHWAARRNRGALYREGSSGDYYYLLRESHVTWVINEAMFITAPREEALMTDPAQVRDLAGALATGVGAFLDSAEPGSGWRQPVPQPADPPPPGGAGTCVDPA